MHCFFHKVCLQFNWKHIFKWCKTKCEVYHNFKLFHILTQHVFTLYEIYDSFYFTTTLMHVLDLWDFSLHCKHFVSHYYYVKPYNKNMTCYYQIGSTQLRLMLGFSGSLALLQHLFISYKNLNNTSSTSLALIIYDLLVVINDIGKTCWLRHR